MYTKESWHQLAAEVVRINHENELAYYYLGRASEEFNFASSAAEYYRRSIAISKAGTGQQRCNTLLACPFVANALAQEHLTALGAAKPRAARPQAAAPARTASPKISKAATPSSGGITRTLLLNSSFFDDEYAEQQVVFKNGKWEKPETPNRKSRNGIASEGMHWEIIETAVGDLNGDGVNDGAFLALNHLTMSNGHEVFLFAVLAKGAGYTVTKPILVGDKRFELTSLSISKRAIHLKTRVHHGTQERGESPKGRRMQTFHIENDVLIDPKASQPLQLPPVAKGDEGSATGRAARGLTRDAIKNIRFKENTIASGTLSVDFKDGRWSKDVTVRVRDTKPWTYKDMRTITAIALGDLNHDRAVDAVFVTIHQGDGNDDYATLNAVWNDGGGYKVSEALYLGAGIRITSLSVQGGKIKITKLVPLDWADAASEQFRVSQSIVLRGKALVEAAKH